MVFGIVLNREEFWTAAFIFTQFGLMYTARQMFGYPDEREE